MTSERKTEDRIEEMQINFYVAQPAVNKIESHGCEGETGRCRCAVDKKRIYERGRQIWQEVRSEVQSEEGAGEGESRQFIAYASAWLAEFATLSSFA